MANTEVADDRGLYCSTAGTYFTNKDALADHYKSEFHRYNLKRKIANMPPVTREWFEARKETLAANTGAPVSKIWKDPLTQKKFSSENTYKAYVNSNKYKDLVKQSGKPAPEPAVTLRRAAPTGGAPQGAAQQPAEYKMKAANGAYDHTQRQRGEAAAALEADDAEDIGEDESGWETASDEDDAAAAARGDNDASTLQMEDDLEEWDVRRSLFDDHTLQSMQANLEYMWKKFGFYFPEADLLADPEGLLKYLGAKLQHGHIPLYVRGDDEKARQFPSLHAVQRHMADTGRFKMAWEDNEDEYEDFYNFDAVPMEDAEADQQLAIVDGEPTGPTAVAGYELVVGGNAHGDGGKALGHRQFARYYKQKYKPGDHRSSSAVSSVLASYHMLGISTENKLSTDTKRQQRVAERKFQRMRLLTEMRSNVNRNLPRNVPF
ncbi:g4005 [Coccomyxa viridis]|uniref:G4005 protein n=1 Tax=Coccomyxa viridis TaxID=1274662 RepID=A0ABP1FP56_9CHLO